LCSECLGIVQARTSRAVRFECRHLRSLSKTANLNSTFAKLRSSGILW
jgi:hypothetical protein